jgi:hypothetical protein
MKYFIFLQGTGPPFTIDRPNLYCGWPVNSIAFVCPWCLKVWGKIAKDTLGPAQIQSASCVNCKPSHWILNPIPGSILDNSLFTNGPDWDLFDALPPELKLREYDLHYAQFERYLDEPSPICSFDYPFVVGLGIEPVVGGKRIT